jgi:hypothetical protein
MAGPVVDLGEECPLLGARAAVFQATAHRHPRPEEPLAQLIR